MTTSQFEQLTLFSTEEMTDIQDAADEFGEPWQELVHDAVMDVIARSAHWGNPRLA